MNSKTEKKADMQQNRKKIYNKKEKRQIARQNCKKTYAEKEIIGKKEENFRHISTLKKKEKRKKNTIKKVLQTLQTL